MFPIQFVSVKQPDQDTFFQSLLGRNLMRSFGHYLSNPDTVFLVLRKQKPDTIIQTLSIKTAKWTLASWKASEESACLFLLSYFCDD